MTTTTGTGLEALQARFGEALAGHLQRHIERRHWDAGRLAAHQRERLRALLARAAAGSAFHARRLAGVDPGTVRARRAGLPAGDEQAADDGGLR
jgi:hypothetical protein